MGKISIKDFKDNTGLIIVTVLLSFLTAIYQVMEPEYMSSTSAVVNTLIGWPLIAWWFMAFWNKVLTKIFQLKSISYGVSFILIGAAVLIF